ncbi:MAG: hypothetical protein ACYDA1_04870 [Vulcanimicrobiaceae bacterium]
MKSYLISIGNSTDGPIGACARVHASSKKQAIERFKTHLETLENYLGFSERGEHVQYVNAYFNPKFITVKDIFDGETENVKPNIQD